MIGTAIQRGARMPVAEKTIAIPPEKHFPQLTVLSVGDLIARAITYTHSNESVSSLFE